MKQLALTLALALTATAPLPAFAGRDQAQLLLQERAYAKQAQMRPQTQAQMPTQARRGAAGPAGDARMAKEGAASRHLELLKRFHPKHAY